LCCAAHAAQIKGFGTYCGPRFRSWQRGRAVWLYPSWLSLPEMIAFAGQGMGAA
jgi:hypothetical protein